MKWTIAFCVAFAAMAGLILANAPQGSKPKPKAGQGAVQMPGDNGKLGVPYQLGAKGEELVFTLEKAEFANRFFMKDQSGFATEGQRLVILTYAVQNPGTNDRNFTNQSFSFTVVSPDDENYECDGLKANGWAAYHPDRRERLNISLKPAQKVRALVAVQIHPTGPINKLIVMHGSGTKVVRYDLRDRVSPMTGCFATNGGKDSVETGIAKFNSEFDLGQWNVTVESLKHVLGNIGAWEPDNGGKFVVLNLMCTNASMIATDLNSNTFFPKMTDTDGSDMPYAYLVLKADVDEQFLGKLDPGGKARIRVIFRAPARANASRILIKDQQYSGRSVQLQVGD